MEVEIGKRLFWLGLILGVLFLAEKAAWAWKNIKITLTDHIEKELKRKNDVKEGIKGF